ncbi:MAG TPA: ABC transporter ATP-binding protein [Actinomycetes bacterium]|nr:ABC transporter ATP-binding protein [Actinomycetes bacterium]
MRLSSDAPAGPRAAVRRRAALRVRGLSVTFATQRGELPAVVDVDLDVDRGELVALLGESGSGKSVTARALMGLNPGNARATARELLVGDHDLLALGEEERRRLRGSSVGLVLQDALSALNPVLSVGDQVGELFRVHRGLSRRDARRRVVELLALVGIPAAERRAGDYPHQFSGGMRQRILIAMSIALQPELLIADEPTTALDVTVQAQILELLDRLRRELDMAVLLITHDLGVVSEVADRVAVMYAGRIVEAGLADDLLVRPAHPYTEALLRAMPQAGDAGEDLLAIPGGPPDPMRLPPGCAFAPRCRWAIDRCRRERPELLEVAGGRVSACHRAKEVLDASRS